MMTATAVVTQHVVTVYCVAMCDHWFAVVERMVSGGDGIRLEAAKKLLEVTGCSCAQELVASILRGENDRRPQPRERRQRHRKGDPLP